MKKPRKPRTEPCMHCPMAKCPNCPLTWDANLADGKDRDEKDTMLNEYGTGAPNANFPNDFS